MLPVFILAIRPNIVFMELNVYENCLVQSDSILLDMQDQLDFRTLLLNSSKYYHDTSRSNGIEHSTSNINFLCVLKTVIGEEKR
jgi:hypothetical protein